MAKVSARASAKAAQPEAVAAGSSVVQARAQKRAGRGSTVRAAAREGASQSAYEAAGESAPARRPGRPSGAARAPGQRARLLDVAIALFARQGIVDTTLGAIAREAGYTPAMVHYYFKTRDQLIDVLIDERFAPLRDALGGAFRDNVDDPVAAITELAHRLVAIAGEYPWFPSLWVREVISEGGLLKKRMNERFGDTHQKTTFSRIAKWQKEGRLNPDLEPSLLFVSILGLTILPLAASNAWRNDPARNRLTAADIARHALALLTNGVGPR
ncbi:TetR/AcrR family transcriptional regulator [Paraburkholderia rhizosphaerae]|uniref:TetR/AcrR family transcriptional regulator n=1 Tax=Paraburkholderia rhizosphaerae TaxID=480658 RepID=UPI001FBA4343|nr:TetR/AcrR family transcriptional regulator [Paraburkholderia rhizosphaerae]